jgi:AcrR family transcriptional regulator
LPRRVLLVLVPSETIGSAAEIDELAVRDRQADQREQDPAGPPGNAGGAAGTALARIAERAGVNPTTVYRRWGSLENLVGAMINATVSERSPLLLFRALIIAGNDPQDGESGQRALLERTEDVTVMFERAAARGEPSTDKVSYFDAVVGPLYGYALLLPGLVRWRAPILVEEFLTRLNAGR